MSSGTAISVITSLYREVATGAPAASFEGLFAPSMQQAMEDLVTRQSRGLVDSYAINDMNLHYDYHVGMVLQSLGNGGSSGQWLIQSVDEPRQ